MKFDTIVITAADAAQAACFRLQARVYEGALAKRILVVPDPGGRRVGTLGSTVHVLRKVPRAGRILICHCGGFSKRLPAARFCLTIDSIVLAGFDLIGHLILHIQFNRSYVSFIVYKI